MHFFMKKRIILIMIALLIGTLTCGCSKTDSTATTDGAEVESPEIATPTDDDIKSSIVGAWMGGKEGQRLGYIFNEDGTGRAALFPMTYTVDNGVITVTVEAFGEKKTASALYSLNDDTLTIETDDGPYVLNRTEMPE